MKLQTKVAIITGSSRGIGAQIAKALAREGAMVVINYAKNKTAADQVVSEIQAAGGEAFAIKADVSKADEVKASAIPGKISTSDLENRECETALKSSIFDDSPLNWTFFPQH